MAETNRPSAGKGGTSRQQGQGIVAGTAVQPPAAAVAGGEPPALSFDAVRHMIEQSEKATEAKFDSLRESIDRKLSRLDHMPSFWQLAGIIFTSVVAGAGVIIAIVAYASDRFDGGVGLGTEIGSKFAENQIAIERNATDDAKTRETVDRLIERMDQLIERLGESGDEQ
jgi:hypothetical protein